MIITLSGGEVKKVVEHFFSENYTDLLRKVSKGSASVEIDWKNKKVILTVLEDNQKQKDGKVV